MSKENKGVLIHVYLCDSKQKFTGESFFINDTDEMTKEDAKARFRFLINKFEGDHQCKILGAVCIVAPLSDTKESWRLEYTADDNSEMKVFH